MYITLQIKSNCVSYFIQNRNIVCKDLILLDNFSIVSIYCNRSLVNEVIILLIDEYIILIINRDSK